MLSNLVFHSSTSPDTNSCVLPHLHFFIGSMKPWAVLCLGTHFEKTDDVRVPCLDRRLQSPENLTYGVCFARLGEQSLRSNLKGD